MRGETGPTVVLIHGLGGSAEATYGDVIERLAREMRVLAFDNRGVGESDQPPGAYGLTDFARDVRELMRELDIEQAHIVGHSLGGMVAEQFALHYPGAALSLVLADCPGEMSEAGRTNFETRAATVEQGGTAAIVDGVIKNGIGAQAKERRPEAVERFRQRLLASADGPYAASCRAAANLNVLPRLASFTKPVLVLWGDQDTGVSREAAERLAAAFPQGRFEVIPESGHNTPFENPDVFAERVLQFVRQVAGAVRR
jgi:pimeloyl-ACP methyl ester carboxylesterase